MAESAKGSNGTWEKKTNRVASRPSGSRLPAGAGLQSPFGNGLSGTAQPVQAIKIRSDDVTVLRRGRLQRHHLVTLHPYDGEHGPTFTRRWYGGQTPFRLRGIAGQIRQPRGFMGCQHPLRDGSPTPFRKTVPIQDGGGFLQIGR